MDEQKINACRALASMFAASGEVSAEEAAYVWRTAADLGLDEGVFRLIAEALETKLELETMLSTITDANIRRFFFRRFVAATLIDRQLSAAEKSMVDRVVAAFGWDTAAAAAYVEHMQGFIEYERKGETLLAKLS
jgi:hypothetical protein